MQQYMDDENVFTEEEEAVVDAVKESLQGKQEEQPSPSGPDQVFIIPLTRRPFFPGLAAPLVIELLRHSARWPYPLFEKGQKTGEHSGHRPQHRPLGEANQGGREAYRARERAGGSLISPGVRGLRGPLR